ncbi:MAG: leucine-rich repeat domain-containing protein [Oscillospiraceae bacterium]|nr:leucine-rich repeat domain-containing protein [Oscillospiraceae bacterium]
MYTIEKLEQTLDLFTAKDVKWDLTYDEVKCVIDLLGLSLLKERGDYMSSRSNAQVTEIWGYSGENNAWIIHVDYDRDALDAWNDEQFPGAVHYFEVNRHKLIEKGYKISNNGTYDPYLWASLQNDGIYTYKNESGLELQYRKAMYSHDLVICDCIGEPTFIEIPNTIDGKSVIRIGKKAFEGKKNLKTVIIPESVTAISKYAFTDCKNLEQITLPQTLVSIGAGAFLRCLNLHEIINLDCAENLLLIDEKAFLQCPKLEMVSLPRSLEKLGFAAFGCGSKLYLEKYNYFEIKGYLDSVAQKYAEEVGFKFIEIN